MSHPTESVDNSALTAHQQLEQELATFRHAFETTAADRDRIADELALVIGERDRIAAERTELRQERDQYRQSFVSTAKDRDRLAACARSMSDPLDAGFVRLNFVRFGDLRYREEAAALTDRWMTSYATENYGEIVKSAINDVRPRIAVPLPKEYCHRLASYYLASLLAYQDRLDEAAPFLATIATASPADGADFLPYDLTQATRSTENWQALALERNAPGAVIVSLWKSASAHLTSMISKVYDVPVTRVSVGEGIHSLVVPDWLRQVRRGGAVTHEHFYGCLNLSQLAASGLTEVFVQVRDPRDVAYSVARMTEDWHAKGVEPATLDFSDDEATRGRQFVHDTKIAADWIADWMLVPKRSKDLGLIVTFLHYEDVVSDLPRTFERIFRDRFDEPSRARLAELISPAAGQVRGKNFRSGIGGEWRSVFSEATQKAANEAIPLDVQKLLSLEP